MASTKTPTPEPPREPSPEPTPRRSSRLKRNETTEDQEETPRSKRPTRGKGTVKNAAVETSAPKESGRRRRKATTEPMSPEREAHPPVPSIPTITETAPSPSEKSSQSTYQPRSESDGPRQSSSLRARTEKTKRAHGSSAHGSRATSPTSGGRYSAREEDLPDMEELEQSKIALPSFSGINFGNFGVPAPSAPKAAASAPSTEPAEKSTLSLGTTGSSGLGVPRASGGPLSRLNASRPRASSPLAATSVVAEPDSPETKTPTPTAATGKADENGFYSLSGGKNTPTSSQPPTTSLFAPPKSNDGSSKPAFSFGLGKPSAPPAAATPSSDNGDVPNFFGRKSAPDSGTATPVVGAPAPFSFGSSAPKPAEPTKNDSSAPFSFGQTAPSAASASDKPAPAPLGSFNFGAKPAESDAKAAPAPLGSFNFGGSTSSSVPAAEKAAPAPLGSFNFGSSKPADTVEKPSNGSAAPSFVSPASIRSGLCHPCIDRFSLARPSLRMHPSPPRHRRLRSSLSARRQQHLLLHLVYRRPHSPLAHLQLLLPNPRLRHQGSRSARSRLSPRYLPVHLKPHSPSALPLQVSRHSQRRLPNPQRRQASALVALRPPRPRRRRTNQAGSTSVKLPPLPPVILRLVGASLSVASLPNLPKHQEVPVLALARVLQPRQNQMEPLLLRHSGQRHPQLVDLVSVSGRMEARADHQLRSALAVELAPAPRPLLLLLLPIRSEVVSQLRPAPLASDLAEHPALLLRLLNQTTRLPVHLGVHRHLLLPLPTLPLGAVSTSLSDRTMHRQVSVLLPQLPLPHPVSVSVSPPTTLPPPLPVRRQQRRPPHSALVRARHRVNRLSHSVLHLRRMVALLQPVNRPVSDSAALLPPVLHLQTQVDSTSVSTLPHQAAQVGGRSSL